MFWFANNQFPTFVYVKCFALLTYAFTRGNDFKYLKEYPVDTASWQKWSSSYYYLYYKNR